MPTKIWENDNFSVYVEELLNDAIDPETPRIQVVVHRKDPSGNDMQPRGYILGHNMLFYGN